MDRYELIYAALPFVVVVALGFGFWVVFRQRAAARRGWTEGGLVEPGLAAPPRDVRRAGRPWWGNPLLWLAVCAVFFVLGVVVWPGLFGGAFLFLPFVWIARPRRRDAVDPRTNGHGKRGDSAPAP